MKVTVIALRRWLPRVRPVAVAAAALLLAACGAATPARLAWRDFDEATGTTVTRVDRPLVYFQDDPARAANARDYLHMAPFEVSQGGRHGRWLWLALWSTIDRGVTNGEPEMPAMTAIRLIADGEPMELEMGAAAVSVPGVGSGPYAAPVATARIHYLPLTVSQVARLGRATAIEVSLEREGEGERPWRRWSGNPAELAALADLFLAAVPASPASRP